MTRLFIESVEGRANVASSERKAAGLTQAELAGWVSRRFVIGVAKGHPRAELDKVLSLRHARGIRPYALPPIKRPPRTEHIGLDEHIARYTGGQ